MPERKPRTKIRRCCDCTEIFEGPRIRCDECHRINRKRENKEYHAKQAHRDPELLAKRRERRILANRKYNEKLRNEKRDNAGQESDWDSRGAQVSTSFNASATNAPLQEDQTPLAYSGPIVDPSYSFSISSYQPASRSHREHHNSGRPPAPPPTDFRANQAYIASLPPGTVRDVPSSNQGYGGMPSSMGYGTSSSFLPPPSRGPLDDFGSMAHTLSEITPSLPTTTLMPTSQPFTPQSYFNGPPSAYNPSSYNNPGPPYGGHDSHRSNRASRSYAPPGNREVREHTPGGEAWKSALFDEIDQGQWPTDEWLEEEQRKLDRRRRR